MKSRNRDWRVLLVLSAVLLPVLSVTAGIYRSEKPDAEQRCEEARELLLAPERERMIEKCIASKKDVDYCGNYYRDYGAGGREAGGRYRKRMYNDIPACREARRNAQRNRAADEGITRGRDADDFTTRESGSGTSRRDIPEGSSGRDGSAPSGR